jgi:uncharacterized protein (TIGR02452 family)
MPLEQTRLNFKPRHRQHGTKPGNNRRAQLREVAAETIKVLPDILSQLPNFDATSSTVYSLEGIAPLNPQDCPGFNLPANDEKAGQKGTRIRILDQDTFDAALELQPGTTVKSITRFASPSPSPSKEHDEATDATTTVPPPTPLNPVAVLNLASETRPGGGFRNGALAQEECLCYRSSLSLSLHPSYYPLPTLSAIYTPNVLLIRTAMSSGHILLDLSNPADNLPVTSVISVAGLRHPDTKDGKFAMEAERNTTKRKIRLSLRVAARQGHAKVVLGALGCGVFANPPGDVAQCFLEVFREDEFRGGWWEDVVFAVLDNVRGDEGGVDGSGNFGVFYRALNGEIV